MSSETKTYEGMFLVDSGQSSFEVAGEPVRTVLERRSAEVLAFKPWDDRRLAYPIRGRKRGLYVLVYFKADPSQMAELEHDCQLDERILRALFLRRDRLAQEQIDAETPATAIGHRKPEAPAEAKPVPDQPQPATAEKPQPTETEPPTEAKPVPDQPQPAESEPPTEAKLVPDQPQPAESEPPAEAKLVPDQPQPAESEPPAEASSAAPALQSDTATDDTPKQ